MPREDSKTRAVKKAVLAYSGGLDTSIILKWLQTTYGCEVVTFTADLGQGEELKPAREKALLLGIKPRDLDRAPAHRQAADRDCGEGRRRCRGAWRNR